MPRIFVRYLYMVSVAALLAGGAWAADYTRLPGNGNAWNDPAQWQPTGVPGASDTARFESTSGSVTLSAATSVGLLDLAGTYAGTLDLNGQTLTASQVSMAGGVLNGGSGSLTVTGSMALAGGTLNAPSVLTLRGNVDFSGGSFVHNNGTTYFSVNYNTTQSIGVGSAVFNHVVIKGYAASTTTINGDLSVAGDLSFGMSGYSGCLLNGGRILAQKNVRMDSNAFGTGGSGPGSATIVFCGSGDQTLDGAQPGRFPNVKIEKPSGVFRLAGAPQVFGSWTWAGADGLDSGASALTIATPYNATVTVQGGPYSYGGVVTFKGWGQFSKHDLIGDFLVQNLDLSMVAYSGNQITGASFVVSGDVRILDAGFGSASWGPGNSTIKLVGGGNHLIASYAAGHFPNMLIDTTGSVTTEGDVIVSGNWTLVNGAFTQGAGTTLEFQAPYGGTQTIAPGASAYGNVKISGDGLSNQNVAGTLNCQNFTLTTRAYTGAKLNGGTVEVHGDFALHGDGFGASDGGPGSAVVKLAGSGTVTAGGLARCPSLVVDTSGTVIFVGSLRLGSHYAHASGTVAAAGSTQTFVGRQDSLVMGAARFGNLIVQKGPYGAPYKVTLDGQAAVSGGFTLTEGTFVFAENAALAVGGDVSVGAANVSVTAGNNSTLELNGAAAQNVNLAGKSVFNVSVTNAAAPVTFTGAYTASGTTSAVPGAALTFASGVTFNTGKLTMNGTPAQGMRLSASTEGSAANVVAAPYQFVRYADIKDINASGGPKIVALHSTDGGNNQNVVFQDAALMGIAPGNTSVTSPAWVEGVSGPDVTSLTVALNGATPFPASRLNPTQYYAANQATGEALGIVLSASAATNVEIAASNAFGESNTAVQNITWTATDLAGKSYSTDQLKIRINSKLRFVLDNHDGNVGETVRIDTNNDGTFEYTGVEGESIEHLFNASGSFIVRGEIGGAAVGSMTVIVVDTNLHGPVACQKDYERTLQVYALPATEAPNVAYAAADPYALGLTVTQVTGDGAQLKLKPASMDSPYFVSRLGDASGPVLDLQPLAVFTVKDLNSHILGFAVDSSGYGRAVIRYQITPRTVIDNDNPVTTAQEGLYFDLGCLGTDMVFAENGLSSLRVHSNRQDADGIFEVEALLSPTGTFVCHSIQPRQINSDNLVGNYLYHNPCVMKAAGGLYLHREMSDETTRDGKTNLYPEGHPEAGKQIFQVWDQDPQIDGRWTSEIEVSAFTPQAMETAFFAEKARKKVLPNRHFTVKVEQPGNSYQFAVRMQPGTTGIKGGADIEDNNGVNRDEVLYEREPSLPENYLKWEGGFPSAYPALNLPPNHWGIDYQDPARKYKSWDSPFQRYYPHPWYTDIGFFKGNMIGKMTVWGTCTPVTSEVPRDHVLPNVRPGAPANPHTNSTFTSNDLLWGGEETEFRDILKFGRLEADGYLETDIPDNGSGQGSTTADISSRNAFPDVVGANVFEVQKEIQVPDPNNPGQTMPKTETYLRTQHEGNTGTASPVPVQITFRAPPGTSVRVGVALARRAEKDDPQTPANEIDNDGKKTHRAWAHLSNAAIFESRGQPEDNDDVKAGKVAEILAFDAEGNITQEKPAERVVKFSMTANSEWFASQVVYIYGIEPSEKLDDLKLVVWGEEIMDWKAYPKEVQTHHYQNNDKDPDCPIKRWYITDEEPLNIAKSGMAIIAVPDEIDPSEGGSIPESNAIVAYTRPWIVANFGDGFKLYFLEDNTPITWRVLKEDSSVIVKKDDKILKQTGQFAFETPTTDGSNWYIEAVVRKVKIPGHTLNTHLVTRTPLNLSVAGETANISITINELGGFLTTEGTDRAEYTAVLRDAAGNLVPDGTTADIAILGNTGAKLDAFTKTTIGGVISGTIYSGNLSGIGKLHIQSFDAASEHSFSQQAVSITVTSAPSTLQTGNSQSGVISVALTGPGGVPDGTPVRWFTPLGQIAANGANRSVSSVGQSTAAQASATLFADYDAPNFAPRPGTAQVTVSVGDTTASKNVGLTPPSGLWVELDKPFFASDRTSDGVMAIEQLDGSNADRPTPARVTVTVHGEPGREVLLSITGDLGSIVLETPPTAVLSAAGTATFTVRSLGSYSGAEPLTIQFEADYRQVVTAASSSSEKGAAKAVGMRVAAMAVGTRTAVTVAKAVPEKALAELYDVAANVLKGNTGNTVFDVAYGFVPFASDGATLALNGVTVVTGGTVSTLETGLAALGFASDAIPGGGPTVDAAKQGIKRGARGLIKLERVAAKNPAVRHAVEELVLQMKKGPNKLDEIVATINKRKHLYDMLDNEDALGPVLRGMLSTKAEGKFIFEADEMANVIKAVEKMEDVGANFSKEALDGLLSKARRINEAGQEVGELSAEAIRDTFRILSKVEADKLNVFKIIDDLPIGDGITAEVKAARKKELVVNIARMREGVVENGVAKEAISEGAILALMKEDVLLKTKNDSKRSMVDFFEDLSDLRAADGIQNRVERIVKASAFDPDSPPFSKQFTSGLGELQVVAFAKRKLNPNQVVFVGRARSKAGMHIEFDAVFDIEGTKTIIEAKTATPPFRLPLTTRDDFEKIVWSSEKSLTFIRPYKPVSAPNVITIEIPSNADRLGDAKLQAPVRFMRQTERFSDVVRQNPLEQARLAELTELDEVKSLKGGKVQVIFNSTNDAPYDQSIKTLLEFHDRGDNIIKTPLKRPVTAPKFFENGKWEYKEVNTF